MLRAMGHILNHVAKTYTSFTILLTTLPRYPLTVSRLKLQKTNPFSTSRSVINFQNTQHPFQQPGINTNHPNQSGCNNLHKQQNTIQKQNLFSIIYIRKFLYSYQLIEAKLTDKVEEDGLLL